MTPIGSQRADELGLIRALGLIYYGNFLRRQYSFSWRLEGGMEIVEENYREKRVQLNKPVQRGGNSNTTEKTVMVAPMCVARCKDLGVRE